MGVELEPNELRALLEKRRVLQEEKVFSDTLFDAKRIMLARMQEEKRERQHSELTTQ
jgi:hypothetical protein